MSTELKDLLLQQIDSLPEAAQKQLLHYAYSLPSEAPQGKSGADLVRFFAENPLTEEDYQAFQEAIKDCERVDVSEW